MSNWESHVTSNEGKLLVLQTFSPGLKIRHRYLFNPSHLKWNTNTRWLPRTHAIQLGGTIRVKSLMAYQDSPDGSDVESAPSSLSSPRQRTEKPWPKSLRVVRSPLRNAKKCEKALGAPTQLCMEEATLQNGRPWSISAKPEVRCSSDTKSCKDTPVLELTIPN